MKIAVSGTYSTGKTTLSHALSYLTGIPATRARTMREILPEAFPGYALEQCGSSELMELGMRRFSERVRAEIETGESFFSDGCPLQEWIYGLTRLKTGFNPAETPETVELWIKRHPEEWLIFEKTLNGFGRVVKSYVQKRYDMIVHLPVEFPFVADGHRPASEAFRTASEELLLKTYRELKIQPVELRGTLPERLHTIVKRLGLETVRSIDEAIRMAELLKKQYLNMISNKKGA
jgi:nicotinamide riboside kinase